MADFIRDARLRVEETTGVSFGKAFLDGLLLREDILLDSEPPARALEAMRALNDSATLRFSHRLQSALYLDGMDLSSEQTYCTLATEHNVDPNSFIALMNSSEIADAVADEFDYVSSLGISGFPTLLLEMGDTVHVLSSGFAPYEHLDTMLRAVFDV
jgi:putative protein-disulfide isomerase